MWGRRGFRHRLADCFRNTPTHVGKTDKRNNRDAQVQKHPHSCGEDAKPARKVLKSMETPPRMWGRHSEVACRATNLRNTPTHVGKTSSS